MVHTSSRRGLLIGAVAGGLGLTACTPPRPRTPLPSPAASAPDTPFVASTAPEQGSDEDIRQHVAARFAAVGITSVDIDVDAHGHGGAHIFATGPIQTVDELTRGMIVGYRIATTYDGYSVIVTLTRPPTGQVGSRGFTVTWGRGPSGDIGPAPQDVTTQSQAALTLFPKAAEDVQLETTVETFGASVSVLISGMSTSTTAVADTYRRLRPAWKVPAGATTAGFAVGSDALFLSDTTLDVAKHESAPLPSRMLSAWTGQFGPDDDTALTIVTHADGGEFVQVKFTDAHAAGRSVTSLAHALIDAHGTSSADLVIQGSKGDDSIDFDAQYCDKPGSRSSRAAYAYYVERNPAAARHYHLSACR